MSGGKRSDEDDSNILKEKPREGYPYAAFQITLREILETVCLRFRVLFRLYVLFALSYLRCHATGRAFGLFDL